MLADLLYRLIGRETWTAAIYVLAPMLLAGAFPLLTTVSVALPFAVTADEIALEPVARAVLLVPVISISGPFLLLALLTGTIPIVGQDGLILRHVLRRYRRALDDVDRRLGEVQDNAGDHVGRQGVRPVAWSGLFAAVPVFPFNVLFARLAFRLVREHGYRGRTLAWAGLVFGTLVTLVIIGLLALALFGHLSLVGCPADSQSVCVAGPGR